MEYSRLKHVNLDQKRTIWKSRRKDRCPVECYWPLNAATVFVFLFSCMICGQSVYAAPQGGSHSSPVRVEAVRCEVVQQKRMVTGRVYPFRRSTVAGEEAGLVRHITFDAGDHVEQGQVLAVLDSDLLQLDLEQAQAQLSENQAVIDERKADRDRLHRDLESLEDLAKRNAAKAKELADARNLLAAAEARLIAAQSAIALDQIAIRRLERRLKSMEITAPFDGEVLVREVEVGQWLSQGGTVAELIEIDRVDAVVDVPEQFVNQLVVGTGLSIQCVASLEPIVGTVRSIIPQADEKARTYPVKIEVKNDGHALLPGMSVRVFIPTGQEQEALTIHRDACTKTTTGTMVYVVRKGMALPVDVQVQFGVDVDRYVILGGLKAGDQIVVEGNEMLYPGASVQVVGG